MASYLPPVLNSGLLAISAAFLSVTVVFSWLYNGQDLIQRSRMLQLAIYLPLLVPKSAFYLAYKLDSVGLALTALGQHLYPYDFHPALCMACTGSSLCSDGQTA